MITSFPILQAPEETKKKKLCILKRGLLCSSKLEFLCNRLKQAKQKQIQTLSPERDFQLAENNCYQQFGRKSQEIVTQSTQKYQSLQSTSRKKSSLKRNEGLNRSFNRTKTDWDHNFVGTKYMQKIKEELRTTKHSSFTQKQPEKNQDLNDFAKQLQPFAICQMADNFRKTQYRRGLSEEQLLRIKLLKQKRRNKIHESLKQFEGKRKINLSQEQKHGDEVIEKSEPLSPWEDYPSQLSSMLMKKL